MTVTIVFVRHGQSTFNANHLIQGQLDKETPLDDVGVEQATRASRAMATLHPDAVAVYSSDLSRAFDTASAIARELRMDVQPSPLLRERHLGVLQGLPREALARLQPEAYAAWKSRDPSIDIPGGGESSLACDARIITFMKSVVAKYPSGKKIIAVTHGGVLGRLFSRGRNAEEKRLCGMRRGVGNLAECIVCVDTSGLSWTCEYGTWASGRFLEGGHARALEDADDVA